MDSFNTDQSGENNEQTQDQKGTFKVGDREYDAEAAAKKISSADEHIARIEQENAELRAKTEKALTEDEVQSKINEALSKLQQADSQESRSGESKPESFDVEKLSKAAEEAAMAALAKREAEAEQQRKVQTQAETFKQVQDKLTSVYGDKVDQVIVEKTGLPLERALEMAKDPELSGVLLRLAGVDAKASASPSSTSNSVALSRNAPKPDNMFEGKDKVTSKDIIAILQQSRQ